MSRHVSRSSLALAAPVIAGLLLTGCGSDAPTVGAPTSGGASSTAAPATPSSPQDDTSSAQAPESSSEAPSSPSSTSSPSDSDDADGTTVTAKNKTFMVTMPTGWHDVMSQVGDLKGMQMAMAAGSREGGVLTNINVVAVESPITDMEMAAKQTGESYRKKGEDVTMLPKRTIADEESYGYRKVDKAKTRTQTQWFLTRNGIVYTITLTNAPSTLDDANKTLDTFIGTWTWKS